MSAPIAMVVKTKDGDAIAWWCPGCLGHHAVPLEGDDAWMLSGMPDAPTLTPNVVWKQAEIVKTKKATPLAARCHCRMDRGVLHFWTDSTHWLAGKAVPMEP